MLLEDDFGNRGPATELQIASTIPSVTALDLYDGGGSAISCSPSCDDTASSTSTASGLAAVLFFLSRRGRRLLRRAGRLARRRITGETGRGPRSAGPPGALVLLLVAGALGAAAPARADLGQLTVGMGISPYKPAIDSETVGGKAIFPIYQCIYDDKTLTEIGGEVDEHLLDQFGSLQVSIGLSATQAQGHAQSTAILTTHKCGAQTKTDVQLTMAKLRPGITYRLDPLLDLYGVPLVPYARLGLVVEGYAFTSGGAFETGKSVDPVGVRFGWEAAGGLMLALDFLDSINPFLPDTTRRGRANGTFNHTFLFAEAAWQPVDSFGTKGFVFSNDDTFIGTGQPILWTLGIAVELL